MLLAKHQKVFIMCLYNMVIYLFVVNIVEHVTHIIFVLTWVVGECHMIWRKNKLLIFSYLLINNQ